MTVHVPALSRVTAAFIEHPSTQFRDAGEGRPTSRSHKLTHNKSSSTKPVRKLLRYAGRYCSYEIKTQLLDFHSQRSTQCWCPTAEQQAGQKAIMKFRPGLVACFNGSGREKNSNPGLQSVHAGTDLRVETTPGRHDL